MHESQKPRICYILPRYDPATGSHFFHLYELLKRACGQIDIFLVIEKMAITPLHDLPFRAYRQKFSFPPLRMLELLFVLISERLRGRRYFYTHYSFFGALASWLVARFFGGTAYYWNCGMPWLYRRSWFEESVFRFVMRRTILVTGTAGILKEYVVRYGLEEKKTRVLPNWIDTERFSNSLNKESARGILGMPQDTFVVLFAHHLSQRKGSHMILPVAARVAKVLKNAIFIVAGIGPEYDNLKLEIRNLKLEKSIVLAGEIPNREISDYFTASNVFFMPSEEEGFPHVLLEAMAAGIPYVASDVGGVREITPPDLQEFVSPSGNIEAFSDKILRIANMSYEERKKIIRAEQEWVRRYDINTVFPKFAELFWESSLMKSINE